MVPIQQPKLLCSTQLGVTCHTYPRRRRRRSSHAPALGVNPRSQVLKGSLRAAGRGRRLIAYPDFGHSLIRPGVKDAPRLVLGENDDGSGRPKRLVAINVLVLARW